MMLTVSLDLPPSLGIKTSRIKPFSDKYSLKRTWFSSYQLQLGWFFLKYGFYLVQDIVCTYEQAGSFPSIFFVSWPSKDTLGKYCFQWEPLGTQGQANTVTFLAQISTLNFIVKKFQIGFSQKALAKKVLNSGFNLVF